MKIRTLFVAACAAASLGASGAQGQMAQEGITVAISGGPLPGVMAGLVPAFEQATGHKVNLVSRNGQALTDDVKQGNVDLVITGADVVQGLAQSGDVTAETPVGISKVGLAVKAGAPKPDISTPDKLKAALLGASSIGYSRFASGQIFLRAVERLGITDEVNYILEMGQNY